MEQNIFSSFDFMLIKIWEQAEYTYISMEQCYGDVCGAVGFETMIKTLW